MAPLAQSGSCGAMWCLLHNVMPRCCGRQGHFGVDVQPLWHLACPDSLHKQWTLIFGFPRKVDWEGAFAKCVQDLRTISLSRAEICDSEIWCKQEKAGNFMQRLMNLWDVIFLMTKIYSYAFSSYTSEIFDLYVCVDVFESPGLESERQDGVWGQVWFYGVEE